MRWSKRIKKIKEYFSDENQPNLDIVKLDEPQEKKSFFGKKSKKKDVPEQENVKEKHHKKRNNLFLNFRRRSTVQIIKHLETKNVFNLFFYTDINNITLILEQGIRPPSKIKLLPKQEYTVWTYLEHATYLELELGNSTRHFFWKWCAEQNINVDDIAIISIDINKLFQNTVKDWGLNIDTNRIQIYETIPVSAIDWILIKNARVYRLAKLYVENQKLKLKLFQGNKGGFIQGSD